MTAVGIVLLSQEWSIHQREAYSDLRGSVSTVSETTKNMDRWLGDGGMALISAVGASFETYGVDGEDLGWVNGTFTPSELACNPHGAVQAGVHALLLDASMNFALNAALPGRDRTQATIEMTTELLRPAMLGERYRLRGEVVRLTRVIGYAEANVTSTDEKLVSRSTGTFLIQRDERDS
jgi:uncharacterized protein (TIGR00369 family)